MRDHQLATTPDPVRTGLRLSVLSICWTLSTSVVAIVLGFGTGSLVLAAFGFTGLLDAAGSGALVTHFRHALRHEAVSERRERAALWVISVGLLSVGVVAAVESVRRLVVGGTSESTPAGLVLAAVSIGLLAALSRAKRRVSRRIPSRALLADSWLSAAGSLMAVATVVGTGATSIFGWWWVDPVAALVVAGGAIAMAAVMARDGGE